MRRQNRSSPFATDVLPIPPFLSPPGPSVVTSPRAPRQFLECLGVFSWGLAGPSWPFSQNRPARTPPSPHPHVAVPLSIYRQAPSTPIYFSPPCVSFPCPHATSHCVFLISPVSVSAQLQLSSARQQQQHTHTHTHTLSLIQFTRTHISSIFLLWAARHGRTGNDLFIVVVAWVSLCAQYGWMHTPTRAHTHTHSHTTCTRIYKILSIVLGLRDGPSGG